MPSATNSIWQPSKVLSSLQISILLVLLALPMLSCPCPTLREKESEGEEKPLKGLLPATERAEAAGGEEKKK